MTPTIFRIQGYRLYFFSREEPRIHIHVSSSDCQAKFWLDPKIVLAKNQGFTERQLRQIRLILEDHHGELISAWQQHFRG